MSCAIKDLAAILRLHLFATRIATVIDARQRPQDGVATSSQPQPVQPHLSPEARSIAEHATVRHQLLHPSAPSPAADTASASMPWAQQAGRAAAETAGMATDEPDSQTRGPGTRTAEKADAYMQWSAPNGLTIAIRAISFAHVILAARKGVDMVLTSQASLHLPDLQPDQDDGMHLQTEEGLSANQGNTRDGLSQRLDARTSLDSLASMSFGSEGLQTLASWGWANDAQNPATTTLQDLEMLPDQPAEDQGPESLKQQQQQQHAPEAQQQSELQQALDAALPLDQVSMYLLQCWMHVHDDIVKQWSCFSCLAQLKIRPDKALSICFCCLADYFNESDRSDRGICEKSCDLWYGGIC